MNDFLLNFGFSVMVFLTICTAFFILLLPYGILLMGMQVIDVKSLLFYIRHGIVYIRFILKTNLRYGQLSCAGEIRGRTYSHPFMMSDEQHSA